MSEVGFHAAANAAAQTKARAFAESVAAIWRRYKVQPISQLDPLTIARVLDAYAIGEIQQAALLWDKIERRDDRVRVVVGKRKRAVAQLAWEILTDDESEEAARHKAALEYLYTNLTASDITKRDMRGGVPTLIRQVMNAIGHGYAVSELLWRYGQDADGHDAYTVEVIRVPLWFFEAKEGYLRLLPSPTAQDGTALESGGWLVCAGEEGPLHEATCLAYLFKTQPLRDWAFYCEKFGMPWVHGKTDATPGSSEWNEFADAIAAAGNDCQIVTNLAAEITIENVGVSGEPPHPKLVDRMDRAIVTLWTGGDLATMSQKGDSTGSNPQTEGLDDLQADDAEFVTEQFRQLDRMCLQLLFGPAVTPKAHFTLLVPPKVETDKQLSVIKAGVEMGVGVSKQHFRDTFSIPAPGDGDELLTAPTTAAPALFPAANAAQDTDWLEQLKQATLARLGEAERQDWQPLFQRLSSLEAATEPNAYATQLQALRDEFPALIERIYSESRTAEIFSDAMQTAAEHGISRA